MIDRGRVAVNDEPAVQTIPAGLPFWRIRIRYERDAYDGPTTGSVALPAIPAEDVAVREWRRLTDDPALALLVINREGARILGISLQQYTPLAEIRDVTP